MNKKLTAILAVILAMSMVFGMTTFAAASPKASDNSGSSSSSSAPVYETPWWIIPRAKDYASVGGVRFTSDYVGTTDNFVATVLPVAGTPKVQNGFGPYLMQMYLKGVPTRNNFGIFTFSIGVGNKYDGKTAYVHVAYFDGTSAVIPVVVTKGKVTVSLNQIGVIAVTFE